MSAYKNLHLRTIFSGKGLLGKKPSRCSAFTLVEMLLVLVIIAVLSGSIVVSLSGRQDAQILRLAAEDLAAAIRFAAAQSKLTGLKHSVIFTELPSTYRVEVAKIGSAVDTIPAIGQAGKTRVLPEGILITAAGSDNCESTALPERLEFYPDGSGYSGRIELTDQTGQSASINVFSQTGQVIIERGDQHAGA